jgi:hypothetical protein
MGVSVLILVARLFFFFGFAFFKAFFTLFSFFFFSVPFLVMGLGIGCEVEYLQLLRGRAWMAVRAKPRFIEHDLDDAFDFISWLSRKFLDSGRLLCDAHDSCNQPRGGILILLDGIEHSWIDKARNLFDELFCSFETVFSLF